MRDHFLWKNVRETRHRAELAAEPFIAAGRSDTSSARDTFLASIAAEILNRAKATTGELDDIAYRQMNERIAEINRIELPLARSLFIAGRVEEARSTQRSANDGINAASIDFDRAMAIMAYQAWCRANVDLGNLPYTVAPASVARRRV